MEIFAAILAILFAAGALVFAKRTFSRIMLMDEGTDTMKKIARKVQEGAMAFLKTEYQMLAVFVAVVFLVIGLAGGGTEELGWKTAIAFLCGALASGLAGLAGMHTATRSAVRTTQAATKSLGQALGVAFSSGTVMGLCVVGFGLGGVALFFLIFKTGNDLSIGLTQVLGFSFGASSIALFARVGGGIYTKAADVGADLVGKVEAGIPEDDPRNPAVIADNVGDNVGDVAGMGADLFESYVGSLVATMLLGATLARGGDSSGHLVAYPLVLGAVGILASFLGTFRVKTEDETKLSQALFSGLISASAAVVVIMALFTLVFFDLEHSVGTKTYGSWGCFGALVTGLILGVVIGKVTEYYTSEQKKPAQEIANQSQTGPATNIIHGLATGMTSVWAPTLCLVLGIGICHSLGGIYGISLAAVGMLSTLGISLGIDAFGPVADNAGGMAEMAGLDPSVRKRTDALDATGNTTAAIGKGFAIGSAALTALALFNTFSQKAMLKDSAFSMKVDDPRVMIGLLVGAMLPFFFSSMAMKAVGRAANKMIEEVRRQFREIEGLLEGEAEPETGKCVAIAAKGSLAEMVAPGLLAILAPLLMGWIVGPAGLGGMLAGALATGVMMALFMANAGGAWDNAKKYIEGGAFGGKGSETHKAAVVGDTVGDPFKDTAGPSLNILIKLMSIVALIFLPFFLG